MAKEKHSEAVHKLEISDLLSRFPITGRDRAWRAEPVVREAFAAAHRIFEKRFKGELKIDRTKSSVDPEKE
jgi:hypothetical protein